jgi:hypothetical protein
MTTVNSENTFPSVLYCTGQYTNVIWIYAEHNIKIVKQTVVTSAVTFYWCACSRVVTRSVNTNILNSRIGQ